MQDRYNYQNNMQDPYVVWGPKRPIEPPDISGLRLGIRTSYVTTGQGPNDLQPTLGPYGDRHAVFKGRFPFVPSQRPRPTMPPRPTEGIYNDYGDDNGDSSLVFQSGVPSRNGFNYKPLPPPSKPIMPTTWSPPPKRPYAYQYLEPTTINHDVYRPVWPNRDIILENGRGHYDGNYDYNGNYNNYNGNYDNYNGNYNVQSGGGKYNPQVQGGNKVGRNGKIGMGDEVTASAGFKGATFEGATVNVKNIHYHRRSKKKKGGSRRSNNYARGLEPSQSVQTKSDDDADDDDDDDDEEDEEEEEEDSDDNRAKDHDGDDDDDDDDEQVKDKKDEDEPIRHIRNGFSVWQGSQLSESRMRYLMN